MYVLFYSINIINVTAIYFFISNCVFQDTFSLLTPGGGGYGLPSDFNNTEITANKSISNPILERGSVYNYRMLQESV